MIGTEDALYASRNGGVVPGGSCRSADCAMAVTCDMAMSICTLG